LGYVSAVVATGCALGCVDGVVLTGGVYVSWVAGWPALEGSAAPVGAEAGGGVAGVAGLTSLSFHAVTSPTPSRAAWVSTSSVDQDPMGGPT
jgi:hypothetical protein